MAKTSFKRFWRRSPYNRGSGNVRQYDLPSRRERRRSARALFRVIG